MAARTIIGFYGEHPYAQAYHATGFPLKQGNKNQGKERRRFVKKSLDTPKSFSKAGLCKFGMSVYPVIAARFVFDPVQTQPGRFPNRI